MLQDNHIHLVPWDKLDILTVDNPAVDIPAVDILVVGIPDSLAEDLDILLVGNIQAVQVDNLAGLVDSSTSVDILDSHHTVVALVPLHPDNLTGTLIAGV
jgi:hypothetical protein